MKFYTYAFYRNDTNQIFYIGKGSGRRAYDKRRNKYCTAVMKKYGYTVKILANWKSEKEAHDHEVFLIDCFKELNHRLTNLTNGGEGTVGHSHSDEHKAYMKTKMIGNTNHRASSGNKGKTFSEDWRKKLSDAAKGRPKKKEHSQKIGNALRGKPKSEAHKQALRSAALNAYKNKA